MNLLSWGVQSPSTRSYRLPGTTRAHSRDYTHEHSRADVRLASLSRVLDISPSGTRDLPLVVYALLMRVMFGAVGRRNGGVQMKP